MPDQNRTSLSAEQVQLIGELLVPHFKEAIRQSLHDLRRDINLQMLTLKGEHEEAMDEMKMTHAAQMAKVCDRLDSLEKVKGRVMLAWGALVLIGTWVFKLLSPYIAKFLQASQ